MAFKSVKFTMLYKSIHTSWISTFCQIAATNLKNYLGLVCDRLGKVYETSNNSFQTPLL